MKKFLVVFLLGLLIAGSAFAQWGNNSFAQTLQTPQTPQTTQTISGSLQIINGTLAIVNAANQVYYVPNLQPYYGANGLFVNAFVTVCGAIANNFCSPHSFMAGGTWYILPGYNNNAPPVQPAYYVPPVVVLVVPMYAPPQNCYPRYYGW
jgi:hypothetical protein